MIDGNLIKFSGTAGIGEDVGLSALNVKYGKFDASAAPTVNDDIDLGYMVGSRWADVTNDKEYVCLDNTNGAAVWTETTQAGVGSTTFIGLTDTPASYSGQAGLFPKVNVGETALEFAIGGGGDTLPVVDTTSIVKGSVTATKQVRFEVDGLTAETTRVLTVQDKNITIADNADLAAKLANIEEDTDPDLGGQLQAGAHSINFTEQILTSGAAIAWDLGNSNKATLTAAHNFTITITAPSGALNAQVIITQDGTGTRVMDEIVTQTDTAIAEAEVHIDTEIIDLAVDIPTGARIRFKSTTTVPAPLVANTIYWAIRSSENHIQVATTKALAIAGTAVNITDDGTGTHTVQQLVKWTSGTKGVLSTAAGSEDILALTYKTVDKQWYAVLNNNFY